MGAGARRKGASFERLVASLIIRSAGKGFGKKDCYRTPMSGGHPYAGASDLVISPALQEVFPFCVECKHYKGWKLQSMFNQATALLLGWVDQVNIAAEKDKFERGPLLVMRGNGTDVYAAAPLEVWELWHSKLAKARTPGLIFYAAAHKQTWKMIVWAQVAKALSQKAEARRG